MNDRYCPDHGDRHDPCDAWAHCPNNDLHDTETCHWFVQEVDRQIKEITEHGNYFDLLPDTTGVGPRMVQEYRDHQPYGAPKQIGT